MARTDTDNPRAMVAILIRDLDQTANDCDWYDAADAKATDGRDAFARRYAWRMIAMMVEKFADELEAVDLSSV